MVRLTIDIQEQGGEVWVRGKLGSCERATAYELEVVKEFSEELLDTICDETGQLLLFVEG